MITSTSPERRDALPDELPLSEGHRREVLDESAVSVAVAAARRYQTITHRDQLPEFPAWQRRAPALKVPMYSPDGKTVRPQIKAKNPRRDKKGQPVKYDSLSGVTPILDVHPFGRHALRDPSIPVLITEGAKTGDAATSRGRFVVVLAGVDGWVSKGGKPLPCWEHIVLRGRLVRVCYDSDVIVKDEVQGALRRLVAYLESRGARVEVIYLPDAPNGEKQGLDDYLAAGGDLDELERSARLFVPVDVGAERMKRDAPLRRAVGRLYERLEAMPLRTQGHNTRARLVRVLTEEAACTGKMVKRDGRPGLRVEMDRRTLQLRSARSAKSTQRAIEALEGEGDRRQLRRDNAGRGTHERGAFVLFTDFTGSEYGKHNGEIGAVERESQEQEERDKPLSDAAYDRRVYPTRYNDAEVPALRGAKVILYKARRDGKEIVAASHYVWRLGEKRGQILRYILEHGGHVRLEALVERFGGPRSRKWDFRRWTLSPLMGWRYKRDKRTREVTKERVGPALVELDYSPDGVHVRALPTWREGLEVYRETTDEIEDARKQAERYEDQRLRYRRRLKAEKRGNVPRPEPTPELAGPEKVQEIVEAAEKRDQAARIEEQRRKVGTTAETFLTDQLAGVSGFAWGEVLKAWKGRGGRTEDLQRAAHSELFMLQREGKELCVYWRHAAPAPEREPAPVAVLREVENLRKPETESPPAEDWRSHPLDCECHECLSPMPMRYVRVWSGA
jgi:hypothetical protein